jgi:tRNA G18 (ribose-2'-O)-methylase SpoU
MTLDTQHNSHGVAPHPLPWPVGEQYDSDLLRHGDRRNVEDRYRYWKVEAIKEDMAKHAFELEVAIENWQHDFNIGTIVRNANAFRAKKVHIVGKRQWNRRGAMVTDAYLEIVHHKTVGAFVAATTGKILLAVDNQPGAVSVEQVRLPSNAVLVFGGEGPGLSDEMKTVCNQMVAIPQYGSTRSVNVGVASGIMMYKWIEEHAQQKNKQKH